VARPGAILVLHGITMSGASMQRTLGPLGQRLEELGHALIAPNGGHRMTQAEMSSIGAWMAGRYRDAGQNTREDFADGRFWDAGEHYDWFSANTDPGSGVKTYHALERSLDAIGAAVEGRELAGVLGFSQGAAMAIIVAALALRGDARVRGVRFGLFMSGFKPVFQQPRLFEYPIAGAFPRLFAIGAEDPIFPGDAAYLTSMAEAFEGPPSELVVVRGLGHEIPSEPSDVERIARFVTAAVAQS
jgi:pimeloyl-ACP methyl ester carboxylesterase